LTRSGWAMLGVGAALLLAGLAFDLVELAAMGTAGAGAVAGAVCWVRKPPALAIRRMLPGVPVNVGDTVEMRLAVSNPTARPAPALTANDQLAGEPVGLRIAPLAAGAERVTEPMTLPTARRGVLHVGPIQFERSDPFRFAVHEQVLDRRHSVYVRPRQHELRAFSVAATRTVDGIGRHATRGSDSFHRLRDYVVGDDYRLIHWPTYARTGELVVREDVSTSVPELAVLLDDRSGALSPDAFEEAIEVAASLVVSAHRAGVPVRLATWQRGVLVPDSAQPVDGFLLDRLTEAGQTDGDKAPAIDGGGVGLVAVLGELSRQEAHGIGVLARPFRWARVVTMTGRAVPVPGAASIAVASAAEFATRWNGGRL
jgi:uncharacterized protein (DUF58 family)